MHHADCPATQTGHLSVEPCDKPCARSCVCDSFYNVINPDDVTALSLAVAVCVCLAPR